MFIYDNDNKKIGFYVPQINNKKNEKNIFERIFFNRFFIFCVLIIIAGVIGVFIGKKIYQVRKKRANELQDDDYDYGSDQIPEDAKING